jgi:hypothetical protein
MKDIRAGYILLTSATPRLGFAIAALCCLAIAAPAAVMGADSNPAHICEGSERPLAWPDGIIPYDISRLTDEQQILARTAMQRWMDTGARIAFVPRSSESAYVNFTGRTNAGNNTSLTGFKPGARADINITAFWWRQGEWMPAHELGHAIGFHHEHARWDRDAYVIIHYENIKEGRNGDYDWIAQTNWLVTSTPYDYYSIMHYRVCWASSCESQCRDADGASPCAVIDPIGTTYDPVIGQWSDNGISAIDAQRAKAAYGATKTIYVKAEGARTGWGTLEKPYPDLAQARRMGLHNVRFIVLAGDGSFSVVAPD